MKTLIAAVIASTVSFGAFAQASAPAKTMPIKATASAPMAMSASMPMKAKKAKMMKKSASMPAA